MANIETLIPHRAPFLLVDELDSVSQEEIVGFKTYDKKDSLFSNCFPNMDFVPATILIESLAQCGGAGVRMLRISEGLFGLASIESATFHNVVEFGKKIKFVIKNLRISERMVRQTGIIYTGNTPALEATWMCIKL
jgi:3-hydroxyacyl-[acyl-carrier-protein] dehydratase